MKKILIITAVLTITLAGCAWNPPTDDEQVTRDFWQNYHNMYTTSGPL